jgi:hypothetical protein
MADCELSPEFSVIFFNDRGLQCDFWALRLPCPVNHQAVSIHLHKTGWPSGAVRAAALVAWAPGNSGPLMHRVSRMKGQENCQQEGK